VLERLSKRCCALIADVVAVQAMQVKKSVGNRIVPKLKAARAQSQ
jgi:hypothetical protein